MNKKKLLIVIMGIFMIGIMVSSILGIMNRGGNKKQEEEGDIMSNLCKEADHPIVYGDKLYQPCQPEQFENCWECINNKIYVK